MKKRGTILIENVVFIVLNLIFLTLLIVFIAKQGNDVAILEQVYSKQIALAIDSAKPVMILKIGMEKGKKLAEKNNFDFANSVKITGNVVTVKLRENGGYSYSFFNNVDVGKPYPDQNNEEIYVITINKK